MIEREHYLRMIAALPILCVDIDIMNTAGEHLLIKRVNEPLKDRWWLVGGRVLKGEQAQDAAIRKLDQELGASVTGLHAVGYFEALHQKHPFGEETPYHALSIVFAAQIEKNQTINLDAQSSEWKFTQRLPTDFVVKRFDNY